MPLLRSMTIWFAQKNQKSSIPNGTRNAEGSLKQQAQIRATGCTANELRTGSGSHAVSHFFTKPAANAVFVRQPETNKGECHRCGWWATIWGWHWWMRGWALVGGELSWERSSSIYRLQALSLEQHPPPPKKKGKYRGKEFAQLTADADAPNTIPTQSTQPTYVQLHSLPTLRCTGSWKQNRTKTEQNAKSKQRWQQPWQQNWNISNAKKKLKMHGLATILNNKCAGVAAPNPEIHFCAPSRKERKESHREMHWTSAMGKE